MSSKTQYWISAALFAIAAMPAMAAAPPAWRPERAVEAIATNAPGGGGDRILRIMANVMHEQRALDVPFNVINKPGGGGAVSYAYLNQHPGDGHYILLASKSLLTNHIVGRGPSYTEFTPVAQLFGEWIAVTVRPDSPLRNGRDLVERLKKDPAALTFGIATSIGNPNHQGVATALKAAGIDVKKMRAVIFPSGGAAITAMLGGHIDVVPITAAFAASLLRGGQVRLLAVASPQRLAGALADVPTWREQGIEAVVSNWRGMVGPKGMSAAQRASWEETLRRFSDSEEWKKELAANFWSSDYMRGDEMRKFLDEDNAQARAFLVDIGLAR